MNIKLIKFFDRYIGAIIILFLRLFKRSRKFNERPNNILVIQLWGIGETILALPAIDALYKKNHNIDILATERVKDVFESFSSYKNLKIVSLSPLSLMRFIIHNYNRYDIVIDMEEYLNISSIFAFLIGKQSIGFDHGLRSSLYSAKIRYDDAQHAAKTFMCLLKPLKAELNIESLIKLDVSKNDKKIVGILLKNLKIDNQKVVGISPNVAESSKCRIWPIKNFAAIADYLIENKHLKVIFIGSKEDNDLIENTISLMKHDSMNIAGRLSLKQTFYLIERLELFIGNDSGPMHIAAAQNTKTIGLFGPNLPVRFGPFGKDNIAVYKGENCRFSPCINVHKGEVPDCLYNKGSSDYQKCMKNIHVWEVISAVKKI